MVTYHSGVDYFTSDPTKPVRKDMKCLACRTPMDGVKTLGHHSWAAAMSKHKTEAWDYYCPNSRRSGHERLVDLYEEAEKQVSKKLGALIEMELNEERRICLKKWKRKR